jgi:hypothetical protein
VQFGALQMTARVCFTKPPTETPNTTSFVEVEEVGSDGANRRVFSGWMFAASPGLHGIEHPVYDIWLVDCKGGTEVIAEPKEAPEELPPIQDAATGNNATPAPQRPARSEPAPARQQPAPRPAPNRAAPLINTETSR